MHPFSPAPVPTPDPAAAVALPVRHGVGPSCVALPTFGQGTVLDFLTVRLPIVSRAVWCHRMLAGDVVDERGTPVQPDRLFEGGLRLYYYRDVPNEAALPFEATVLHQDDHLVVADKPHFMPVTPSGDYLHSTLLVRLKHQLGLPDLAPLHRIDRDTAGLVMFSVQRPTRGAYHALFSERRITKLYDAIAPWRADVEFPRDHHSRMEESPQFFRMHEVPGIPNSHSRIEVLEVAGAWARYRLSPTTGKRHQLRVHMAALGLPLRHDPLYPAVVDTPTGDYTRPLQLLAHTLAFIDPLTGVQRRFQSPQRLALP